MSLGEFLLPQHLSGISLTSIGCVSAGLIGVYALGPEGVRVRERPPHSPLQRLCPHQRDPEGAEDRV